MVGLKQGSTLKSGKYKIVKTLGQGSFGITYLATTRISMDGQLGKMDVNVNVTIKEFFMSDLNSRSSDGTNVERTSSTLVKNYLNKFRKEAENLAKLHHPNIVKVLEVFDENNTTYYVMEYVDGETIDEYIKSKGHLSESESLKITQDVCSALSYMHEHKMLHLDLKPKNIMRNSDGHIFLIDFGLAKQYTEDGKPESSTSIGPGTPGYAPIEQAHYKQDGSFPVTLDIYAVGASLYKMLTGKTPPDSSLVLNEGLPLPVLKSAGVSEGTIAIVEKAMASMKKERFQSVKALLLSIGNSSIDEESTTIQEDEEKTGYNEHAEYVEYKGSSNKKKEEPEVEDEFEDDEQSFFEKYWKYGLAATVLLLWFCFCYNRIRSSLMLEEANSKLYSEIPAPPNYSYVEKYPNDKLAIFADIQNTKVPLRWFSNGQYDDGGCFKLLLSSVEYDGKSIRFHMQVTKDQECEYIENIAKEDLKWCTVIICNVNNPLKKYLGKNIIEEILKRNIGLYFVFYSNNIKYVFKVTSNELKKYK